MNSIKKLYHSLRPRKVETLVYRFDLDEQSIPSIAVSDIIQVETNKVDNGRRIFKALINDAVINRNYLYKNNLLALQLGYKHLPLIGGCSTDEQFRGRNIYPYMLIQILHWVKANKLARQVLIFVEPGNTPSINGIEKAGFKKLHHVILYRLLGLCIYKRYL